MSSIIKSFLLFCLLLCSVHAFAQETPTENTKTPKDEHYLIFEIGPYYPLAFGNNSANKGLDQNTGGQFVYMFKPFGFPLLLGGRISIFDADIISEPVVGRYESSTSTVIGPTVGYQILRQRKWRGTVNLGVSYVRYHNHSPDFDFKDDGVSLSFTPSFGYQFTKNFGLYLSASYRHDFLSIKAPSSVDSYLNQMDYVSFSAGLRIVI